MGFPVADDQGYAQVCTHASLSKAIVNGFLTRKFFDRRLDFHQHAVTTGLINILTDLKSRWPHEFDQSKFILQDASSRYFENKLQVKEIVPDEFRSDRKVGGLYEHVVGYNACGIGHHCVYVQSFDTDSDELMCLNSWGVIDPTPVINISDIKRFYRVSVTAIPLTKRRPGVTEIKERNKSHDEDLYDDEDDGEKDEEDEDTDEYEDEKTKLIQKEEYSTVNNNQKQIVNGGRSIVSQFNGSKVRTININNNAPPGAAQSSTLNNVYVELIELRKETEKKSNEMETLRKLCENQQKTIDVLKESCPVTNITEDVDNCTTTFTWTCICSCRRRR